jgi:N-formylglutamate amidohydrolase
MPSAAAYTPQKGPCDFVLGDRFGQSCDGTLTDRVELFLKGCGYRVVRNNPYAGGYTTEHYGRPQMGVHALQIEISRALYLNEATLATAAGFAALRADLEGLFAVLAAPGVG